MDSELLVALVLFSIVTSITPGPNNIMLLASGVNFGFQKSLPHTLGISGGFFVLLIAVGFGLGFLFTTFPPLHIALKIASSVYMLYLAFQIATSRSISKSGERQARPMNFIEAALFQWVNPKAWVMAISSMALYTSPQRPFISVVLVALIFAILNWPSVSIWAAFGTALRGCLANPVWLRRFNMTMGVLLAASVLLLLK